MKGGALWRRHIDQLRNGVADTQSDDILCSSNTDDEPVIPDSTEFSEAPTAESSTTPTASSTEMTQSHRYPQSNHNPPDRYIEQC